MFFKICVLVACASAVSAESSPDNNLFTIMRQCAIEFGVNELFPADLGGLENCIFACSMKRLGTLENGYYQAEKVVELLPKDYANYDDVVSTIRTCGAKYGKTDCETAGLVRECFEKNLPCDDSYQCHLNSIVLSLYNSQFN